ncbi:MAG: tRNA adenosine(34) deaminase TadA [Desulfobacterales bacterium]|nr:tRNA adenosine(34) deaminase TadA [Desulfobacterales bacterium]
MNSIHTKYMQMALCEAVKAGKNEEVPVGAVLVSENGEVLSKDHNRTIALNDPTAHAEILVLRTAARKVMNYRLLNTTLYVTIEPCIMCMGAIIHSRLARVAFGACDPKWGAAGSLYNFAEDGRLNHRLEILSGICRDDCKALIRDFFRKRRVLTPTQRVIS